MKVEELEVDRLYQSVCSDITNWYVYRGGHGRKWCETKYKPWQDDATVQTAVILYCVLSCSI